MLSVLHMTIEFYWASGQSEVTLRFLVKFTFNSNFFVVLLLCFIVLMVLFCYSIYILIFQFLYGYYLFFFVLLYHICVNHF